MNIEKKILRLEFSISNVDPMIQIRLFYPHYDENKPVSNSTKTIRILFLPLLEAGGLINVPGESGHQVSFNPILLLQITHFCLGGGGLFNDMTMI